MRHKMSIATIEGAVEEVADEMAGLERAIPPPIGAEATQEAEAGTERSPGIVGTQKEGGGGDFGQECS